jgi:hypothetical protein
MAARFLSFVIRHCSPIVNPKIGNLQLLFPIPIRHLLRHSVSIVYNPLNLAAHENLFPIGADRILARS